jgi:hypothetical protein
VPGQANRLPSGRHELPAFTDQVPGRGNPVPAGGEHLPTRADHDRDGRGDNLPDGDAVPAGRYAVPGNRYQVPSRRYQVPAAAFKVRERRHDLPAGGHEVSGQCHGLCPGGVDGAVPASADDRWYSERKKHNDCQRWDGDSELWHATPAAAVVGPAGGGTTVSVDS